MRDMDYRLWIGMSAAIAGLIAVVINIVQGDVRFALILTAVVAVGTGVLLWWTRPGRATHIGHAAARAAASDADVILYWRPG